jgi:hypothetical protein
MNIELQLINFDLAIAKLSNIKDLEKNIGKARFISFTKTDDEISLVIDVQHLQDYEYVNTGWKAFKIIGPLDFSLVGILQKVIEPLSEEGISVFTISSFDTDYILIKNEQLENAISILSKKFTINK